MRNRCMRGVPWALATVLAVLTLTAAPGWAQAGQPAGSGSTAGTTDRSSGSSDYDPYTTGRGRYSRDMYAYDLDNRYRDTQRSDWARQDWPYDHSESDYGTTGRYDDYYRYDQQFGGDQDYYDRPGSYTGRDDYARYGYGRDQDYNRDYDRYGEGYTGHAGRYDQNQPYGGSEYYGRSDQYSGQGRGYSDYDRMGRSGEFDSQTRGGMATGRRIRGTIEQIDTLHVFGTTHLIAAVQTDRGRRVLVDLGPQDQLRQLDLREGGYVTVQGRPEFLTASQIESEGQFVRIRRSEQVGYEEPGMGYGRSTGQFREGLDQSHWEGQGGQSGYGSQDTWRRQQGGQDAWSQQQGGQDTWNRQQGTSDWQRRQGQSQDYWSRQQQGSYGTQGTGGQQSYGGQTQGSSEFGSQAGQTFSGQVVSTYTQSDPNTGRSHLIARIQTDQGRSITVDLGPQSEFQNRNLDLTAGDTISVRAQRETSGRQAGTMKAQTAWVNGQQVTIQQSGFQSGRSRQAGGSDYDSSDRDR